MAERRSQRQLRDQALSMHEKRGKSVSALAFSFGVSRATMQNWLAQARRERHGAGKDAVHDATGSDR